MPGIEISMKNLEIRKANLIDRIAWLRQQAALLVTPQPVALVKVSEDYSYILKPTSENLRRSRGKC